MTKTQSSGPQQVPHSREAEEATIGAVLINPASYVDIAPIIQESNRFYIHRNGWIWDAIVRVVKRGDPIDWLTITEELDKMGHLAELGGAAYVTKLMNNVPSSLHGVAYAKRVAETYWRRDSLSEANQLAKDAYNEEKDIYEARVQHATKVAKSAAVGGGAVHITEWIEDGEDYLVGLRDNPRKHAGFSTGLGDLDKVFGDGLLPGMNILMGDPGLGKTILAQQITMEQVKRKIPVAFYSGEMIWRDMYLRMLSAESKVKVSRMRKGDYRDGDWKRMMEAAGRLSKLPLFVDDPRHMTTMKLRSDLERLRLENGIRVMVFDYLGKLVDLKGKVSDEWKRTEEIAYRVQPILVDLDIAGLVVHQITKKGSMAGGVGVAYESVCAVQIKPGDSDNTRKIVNIKPPRGVEGYWFECQLFKDPLLPKMGQLMDAKIGDGYEPTTEPTNSR